MQAIVSDIIVSQAAQTGSLLVSQTLNNSSSNSVSFADMLNSLNTNSEAKPADQGITAPKDVKPAEPEQPKPVDNAKDSEKSEKIKDEKLTAPKENDETESSQKTDAKKAGEAEALKKVPVKKDEKPEPKDKKEGQIKAGPDKNTVKEEEKQTPYGKKVKTEDEKKALVEKNRLETIKNEAVQENQEELIAAATAAGQANQAQSLPKEINSVQKDSEFKPEDLTVKTDLSSSEEAHSVSIKEKISVIDMRTKVEAQDSKPVEKTAKNLKVEYTSDSTATVTMDLEQQMQYAGENILSLDNQTAASNGSDFQAMVNNQIQANIPDFVRTGTVLLKDNDKGTINLVLHPDDLGNVKIHLSMDGKTVSAHITVNTKEALEVFKDNAQTLREAFAKNGYDTASFDVSYNGNSNGQGNQDFKDLYDGSEFMARNAYSDFLGGGLDDGYIQDAWEKAGNSEYLINIVA
ncbi:MAG: flagellar hook-length control protein FliK [Treponema sp.]|nr:flagellar hook-length control protein FliK [Treponema sp.]